MNYTFRRWFRLLILSIFMQVDTAGWLERTKEKGPASLSIMQTKKNLMRAHVVALVLDGEEVCQHLFRGFLCDNSKLSIFLLHKF